MIRTVLLVVAALSITGAPAFAKAAPCRGAGGKFVKCPPPAAAAAPPKTAQCRDAKGHFAKCGAPGAKLPGK